MEDWQKRIIDEKAALDTKASALSKYIESIEGFDPASNFDEEILNEQLHLMLEYSNILNMRIIRFQ